MEARLNMILVMENWREDLAPSLEPAPVASRTGAELPHVLLRARGQEAD
jgi:hypothetical protein